MVGMLDVDSAEATDLPGLFSKVVTCYLDYVYLLSRNKGEEWALVARKCLTFLTQKSAQFSPLKRYGFRKGKEAGKFFSLN
jgi:hypothetical protein